MKNFQRVHSRKSTLLDKRTKIRIVLVKNGVDYSKSLKKKKLDKKQLNKMLVKVVCIKVK